MAAERRAFERRVRAAADASHPRPLHAVKAAVTAGLVLVVAVSVLLDGLAGPTPRVVDASTLAFVGGLAVHAALIGRWSRTAQVYVVGALARWPTHLSSMLEEFQRRSVEHPHAFQEAAREWTAREDQRVALLTRVSRATSLRCA